jgi:hypothetical protein
LNNHNAIALAISSLQTKWQEATDKQNFQLVRWLIEKSDTDIFNGFLRLESTAHGSLEETFLILFTPFLEAQSYTYFLIKDWLEIFAMEVPSEGVTQWSDYARFKAQWELLSSEEHHQEQCSYLLAALLQSFKKYRSESRKLIFGLLPYVNNAEKQYANWVENTLPLLPEDVALMIVDDLKNEKYERLFNEESKERITISATKCFNAQNVYQQLATSGNPDDPQIAFRQCVFKMGESAQKGNKQEVCNWGEKALTYTQASGDKLLWASAHIVYASFLFGFKATEKIDQLLNQGIIITQSMLDNAETQTAASGLLGQFYGYKAAYLNMLGEHAESILWFKKQADVYIQYKQEVLSIGAFQNALLVASKHRKSEVGKITEKAFPIAYAQADDSLRGTGFPVIAYHYLIVCKEEEKKDIETRMQYLYGANWKASAKKNFAIAPEEYVL